MAKSTSLLASVPDSYAIILIRAILLILSIAGIAVYAITISNYKNRVAPVGALAPTSGSSILNVNIISVVVSVLSTLWSFIHLGFLAHRLLETHARGRRRNSNGREEWSSNGRPVIHPRWVLLADGIFWVWFIVMAVLTGTEASHWKDGKLEAYGSSGTRQVDLKACPTTDPVSGKMDYWCLSAWNQVVDLSQSGTSILGVLAGMHSNRAGVAGYEWYRFRRYHRLGGGWCWRAPVHDEYTTGNPERMPHQSKDIELERT